MYHTSLKVSHRQQPCWPRAAAICGGARCWRATSAAAWRRAACASEGLPVEACGTAPPPAAAQPQPQDSQPPPEPPMRVAHSARAAAAAPLPDALRAALPGVFPTMTAARKACRRGRVRAGGARGGCGTQVAAGQLLEVLEPADAGGAGDDAAGRQPRRARARPPPPGTEIRILHDDDHITAVVKPWGIKIHGWGSHHLAGYVKALVPPSTQADALPGGPHPAHRLDLLTGGVMLCAKTRSAAADLTRQFESREVHKRYRALVAGRLEPPGTSSGNGGDSSGGGGGGSSSIGGIIGGGGGAAAAPIIVDAPVEGRAARTEVFVAGHSRCLRYGGWVTTVDLRPLTGRRHQLRRHLALCLGHPILGDPLYTPWAAAAAAGGAAAAAELLAAAPDELRGRAAARGGPGPGGDGAGGPDGSGASGAATDASSNGGGEFELLRGWGMALWAGEIECVHPATGERMRWSLPEPPRFEKLRAQQAARWSKFYGGGGGAGAV